MFFLSDYDWKDFSDLLEEKILRRVISVFCSWYGWARSRGLFGLLERFGLLGGTAALIRL